MKIIGIALIIIFSVIALYNAFKLVQVILQKINDKKNKKREEHD